MKPINITPELLRELVRYEPETGKLFWKERDIRFFTSPGSAIIWNADNAGKEIRSKSNLNDYRNLRILGESFGVHRLVWAIHYGEWPSKAIDHINGQKSDNRLCNLREVSASINARNKVLPHNNKTGHIGVRKTQGSKYSAHILSERLGTFDDLEEAAKVRQEAQAATPGFTERHGKPSIADLGFVGLKEARKQARRERKALAEAKCPIMSHSRVKPIKPRQLPVHAFDVKESIA